MEPPSLTIVTLMGWSLLVSSGSSSSFLPITTPNSTKVPPTEWNPHNASSPSSESVQIKSQTILNNRKIESHPAKIYEKEDQECRKIRGTDVLHCCPHSTRFCHHHCCQLGRECQIDGCGSSPSSAEGYRGKLGASFYILAFSAIAISIGFCKFCCTKKGRNWCATEGL